MAMSTVGTAPNAIIADLYRGRAGQALNALHLVVGIGAFAGPLLIGAALRMGRRLPGRLSAGDGTMLLVGVLWVVSRPPRPHRQPTAKAGAACQLSLAPLILVFGLIILYTGTEQVLGGWLFTYARDTVAMAAATASLISSVFWLAILLGRLTAVHALRRMTNLRLAADLRAARSDGDRHPAGSAPRAAAACGSVSQWWGSVSGRSSRRRWR